MLRPGACVVIASSRGDATPFYTPEAVLERGFRRHGIEFGRARRRGRRDLLDRTHAPQRSLSRLLSPLAEPKRHLLLVNPSAGGGRTSEMLPKVERALSERGLEYELVLTTGIEHGCEQAVAAAGRGEIPVVVSGDGLIGQVGGALAGTGAVIGVIPGGRGNDLARVLGIPVEPEAAVEVLATGRAREIDVGDIDGKRFLGIASCGFDSDANRIANEAKWVRGQLVYALRGVAGALATGSRPRSP